MGEARGTIYFGRAERAEAEECKYSSTGSAVAFCEGKQKITHCFLILKNMKEKISVCIPVYNGADTILETIQSILDQTFKDFELIVVDNNSTDNTLDLLRTVQDNRIKIYRNQKNIGCAGSIERCKSLATGDILFYICADDLADVNALKKISKAFQISEDIGIVTRPYYWFDESVQKPVRTTKQFSKSRLVTIHDSYEKVKDIIALADQLSGMAFKKKYMGYSFKRRYFVETASMVVNMLKNCKAIILKDNIIAVRIGTSASKSPLVYKESPLLAWHDLIRETYHEPKFRGLRKYLINHHVTNNYIGLVQIRNYGSHQALFREIFYLLKLRWRNIFIPQFWFFSLGTLIMPRALLRKLVVIYKNKVNAQFLKNISINLKKSV